MNEFKFLLEKNIDHNIAHDHITYMKNSFCVFLKKKNYEWPSIFILKPSFTTVLNFTDFVNEIYKVGQKWKQWRLIQLIKER